MSSFVLQDNVAFEALGEGTALDFFEVGADDGVVRLRKSLKEDSQGLTVYTVCTLYTLRLN